MRSDLVPRRLGLTSCSHFRLHEWLHVTYHNFLPTSSLAEDSRRADLRQGLCGTHQPLGDHVEKPQLVDFAEVNVGGVFDDEAGAGQA